jgi:sulfite exporter TauE/SafE
MQLPDITSPLAALTAGLVTSIHCIGMCGPLACTFCPKSSARTAFGGLAAYHGGRILSYTAIGVLLGTLGGSAAWLFAGAPAHWLPWAFAAFFLCIALGLEKRIPVPAAAARLLGRVQSGARSLGPARMGGLLGVLTPFLPCGPLYLVAGVALFSGSGSRGASLMAAFAAGTIPLLFAVQSQTARFQTRLSPVSLRRLQRALALVSACLIVWRTVDGATFDAADPAAGAAACCGGH